MGPRTLWLGGILLALAGTVGFLSRIRTADGEYLLCRGCWFGGNFHPHWVQGNPSTTLKSISSAQADFRANDRDADGVNQFWRADIAGLYALAPGGGSTIRLIELRTALADERPGLDLSPFGRRKPLGGYWFRAIRHAEEQTIDATARFAAVAFPDRPAGKTRWTYIIDENNTVYRAALGAQRGIEVFPADDDLKRQWSKLD